MATAAMKRRDVAEPNTNSDGEEVKMTALWMQRLGTLFPSNASIQEEIQTPADESSSHPTTRRLSVEVVLRNNVASVATSAGSDISSNAPSSILKSDRVHSSAIDANLNVNGEAAKDTVYMLRLLMMSDFFSGNDRVNLGLPATESHPNTSLIKPDSSIVAAVKISHVNSEDEAKEEERGGEGKDNEQLFSDVALKANIGHPPQPQTSLASLLAYKPIRAHSSNNIVETAVPSFEESFSSHVKALRSTSANTAKTQCTRDSDSQSQPSPANEEELHTLKAGLLSQSNETAGAIKTNEKCPTQMTLESSILMNYKPQRKISPPSSENNLSERISRSGPVFDSFNTVISTPSTGTFRDTKKRFVPTLANSSESEDQDINTRNNSWGVNLKEKPCSNDTATSPLTAAINMLKQNDLFPSTGTFRDSAKRHVRTTSDPNQEWDTTRPSVPSPEKAAVSPRSAEVSVRNFLKDNIFPSTGTFRDTSKRHVRHITEPRPNQEWELRDQNQGKVKSFTGPSIGLSFSAGSIREVIKRKISLRQLQQELEVKPSNPNEEWGELAPVSPINTPDVDVKDSEPKNQTNLFQLYMENKAKHGEELQPKQLQRQPSMKCEAGIPPEAQAEPSEAAELREPAPKGELLVDWGDQGSDSEYDESLEEEENNGTITFVKNDSSRRISDITTADDFDDSSDDELGLDSSLEMRERIRRLSIPEGSKWMQSDDHNEESSDEKQNRYSSRRISDLTTDDDFDDELDFGPATSLEMRQRIRSLSIPEEPKWMQRDDHHEESDEKQDDCFFFADTEEVVESENTPPTGPTRRTSEDTSASSETLKTSGRKGNTNESSIDNSVEMGKGLIRNMSAFTLHEMSDEELDEL